MINSNLGLSKYVCSMQYASTQAVCVMMLDGYSCIVCGRLSPNLVTFFSIDDRDC